MTTLAAVRHAPLAGMAPTVEWRVRHHFNFMFEIDADLVRPRVPSRLGVLEVRPGVALLNIGYMRLEPGHLGGLPAFDEVTFSVQVHPDLSLDMPMPRLTVFDLRIGSNSREFLEYEDVHQQLNGYYSPGLCGTLNEAQDALEVSDDDGPLFVLRNTHPAPHFKRELACGQYYSSRPDGVYQGVFQWDGVGCEHQRAGDAGQLFNHPFFQELDVERDVQDCYMQMLLPRDLPVTFRSYSPRKLG